MDPSQELGFSRWKCDWHTHTHAIYCLLQFMRHVQVALHRHEKRVHPLLRSGVCTLTPGPSVSDLAKMHISSFVTLVVLSPVLHHLTP